MSQSFVYRRIFVGINPDIPLAVDGSVMVGEFAVIVGCIFTGR
jgi:hypothetical protein